MFSSATLQSGHPRRGLSKRKGVAKKQPHFPISCLPLLSDLVHFIFSSFFLHTTTASDRRTLYHPLRTIRHARTQIKPRPQVRDPGSIVQRYLPRPSSALNTIQATNAESVRHTLQLYLHTGAVSAPTTSTAKRRIDHSITIRLSSLFDSRPLSVSPDPPVHPISSSTYHGRLHVNPATHHIRSTKALDDDFERILQIGN